MADTETVAYSDLIEDALIELYRSSERPLTVELGATAGDDLANAADTLLRTTTADDGKIAVGDRLSYDDEVMVVSAVTAGSPDTVTVRRTQYGSTNAGAVAAGELLLLNAPWERYRVKNALERYIKGRALAHMPIIQSVTKTRTADKGWVALDATTARVVDAWLETTDTGERLDLDVTRFDRNMPTALVASGKALKVPTGIADDRNIYLTVVDRYQWTTGGDDPQDETDTLTILYGSRDVFALHTAAVLHTGRELTRLELDVVEEWSQEQAIRQGVNIRVVRELWGQYFTRVDEVMDVHNVGTYPTRPFRRRRRWTGAN